MTDDILAGHSSSQLERQGNFVIKRSSYLANCRDVEARGQFLAELSNQFAHMPKIVEVNGDLIKYRFVEGEAGFESVDMKAFGGVVKKLHDLNIESAPEIETGIHWLRELAETNLEDENVTLDLDRVANNLRTDSRWIVHGEITDLVIGGSEKITILDWDEAGLGNRYQDLGMVYFKCVEKSDGESDFKKFLAGYSDPDLKRRKILLLAGLIAIAYSRWGNSDFRLEFGTSLLSSKLN